MTASEKRIHMTNLVTEANDLVLVDDRMRTHAVLSELDS